jgi:hypothetical protein
MRTKLALLVAVLLPIPLLASLDQPGDGGVLPAVGSPGTDSAGQPVERRRVGPITFTAAPESGRDLPSTRVIGPEDFQAPWPLLSVVTDEANLHDPETGIFANIQERGRAWERPASMSYFEDGALVFATGVGIRLHGGSTRHRRKQKRIRLYFRQEYGAEAFASGLLFGPESQPLRTLVVRTDDEAFATPLAFDIARRLGALAPETEPVHFFLNGDPLGQYYLVEHQSSRQWASHFGHGDFLYYRYKSNDPLPEAYRELDRWARNPKSEVSIEAVRERIDVDNFSRHLLSIVYCATNDWIQGAAVLDTSRPDSRWFFVNWDMDHSFVDYGAAWMQGNRPKWEQEAFELLFSHRNFRDRENPDQPIGRGDLRKVIFTRLWQDSPEYRAMFARLTMDVLNHRLQRDYLLSRLRYYRDTLGVAVPEEREDFLLHRADFVRSDLRKWFELGEIHDVSLESTAGVAFEVDGYPEEPGYRGRYFAGEEIRVSVAGASGPSVDRWRVNGEEHPGPVLALPVLQDLEIEPVFR